MRTHIRAIKYFILAIAAILLVVLLTFTQPQNDLVPLLQGKLTEELKQEEAISKNKLILDSVKGIKKDDIKQTVMEKPNFLGEDLNSKLWALKANKAVQNGEMNQGFTDLFEVIANTLNSKDRKVDYLADQGRYISKTQDVLLEGNVLIKSEKLELKTQTLQYNLKTAYAESNSHVDISADFGNIVADSMQSFNNAERLVLKGNVRAKLYQVKK